jgi:ribosomal protein S8
LSSKEKDELGSLQDRLLDHGENILALSVSLKMHEVSESLKSIQRITDKVKTSLKKMEDIQKVIDIASAAVTLASAIVIRDMKAIQAGIGGLVSTVKENGTAHL